MTDRAPHEGPIERRPVPVVPKTAWKVPPNLRIHRNVGAGLHPIASVFEGLSESPPFDGYPGSAEKNRALLRMTSIHVVDEDGWMYVAPHELPGEIKALGYDMVTSPDEVIVVGHEYLRDGPELDLYLDIIHEFLHILQRAAGRELWPGLDVPYVDRPTEIEAYAFSVAEARRLGVDDEYLAKYLEVEWVTAQEHQRLLSHVGVGAGAGVGKRVAAAANSGKRDL
ncbi:MAG: hypothetical protein ACYDDF_07400 [Thermoplasmatota archaeon]